MIAPKTDQEFFEWNEAMAAKYNPDEYHRSSNRIVRWIEGSRVKRILSFLDSKPEHRVLEVGVGAGNILVQVPAKERHGLDLSPMLLELARKRLPDASLYQGDAETFPGELREQRFDRVYCSEVLEHVRHPERVVAEMEAVLAPNGVAVISVPNEKFINALKGFMLKLKVFRLLFPRLSTKMDDEWHLHTFDRKLLREKVGNTFVVERIDAVPYAWLPIRLVARLRRPGSIHAPSADSDLISSGKNRFKRFPKLYRFLVAVFGTSTGGLSPERYVDEFTQPGQTVLNLGSGAGERYGQAIHVDLYPFPGVDVVADIANLPYEDASVDAILCIQVLEHVRNPQAVLAEIRRVLKPNGTCYLTTPFLYPYHSSPNDYTRWTLDGLRGLASGLTEVRSGLRHGPTSGLAVILAHWLAAVMSLGFERAYEIFSIFWMAILAPLAHIPDFIMNRMRVSEKIASGHYLVARKPVA